MILYFDTSALIKLVMIEDDSEQAAELWNSAHPTASSILVYPESRAALAAAHRGARLTTAEYKAALSGFHAHFDDLITVGVDDDLALSAGAQAEAFGLRGYDAVHLASASGLGEVTLVTWDEELTVAAESVGLAVAGVGSE
ncbi:MAG TPA: type II toxin-antitoxin system VapC family toxin [Solirubrobacterales bacterium]|nr:type II toxin-antitoxin system VapC family toxin [Solirubrobacterales bacterium]